MKTLEVDKKLLDQSDNFMKQINSNMHFTSEFESSAISFDWLDQIELICTYIDNIVRNPKYTLINEDDVVKIEKARKVTVDSVKDLSKHTNYIDKVDPITEEVQPSKLLIVRREDTFSTYENRFIYTLIINLSRFIYDKEQILNSIKSKNDKVLEYSGNTNTGSENVNIRFQVTSNKISTGKKVDQFNDDIDSIKERVAKIRDYISGWRRSEFFQSLVKNRANFVHPPIKRTNVILKNPNFQMAMKLWEYLQSYNDKDQQKPPSGVDSDGNDMLKEILNDTFLTSYYVMDSISESKRNEKNKLVKYAAVMITQQIKRIVSLLISSGIDIEDDDIINMIMNGLKEEKERASCSDIQKKFKDEINEYLKDTQDSL